jgi:hypothetical protein
MRWALWADTEATLRMALALTVENTKRMMQERGIAHFTPTEEADGTVTLTPVPTIH